LGRFDRYILSQLFRVFGFFALVLVGIYWINRAVILLERYLAEGQGGGLVLQLTLLSVPTIMVFVLPVAGFAAATYVTNRLHSDSELVVIQATGYSVFRLVRPFLVFGLLLALLLSVLAHLVVPASQRHLEDVETRLREAISARLIVPGTFQSPTPGVTVYVREVDPDGALRGLLVRDRREIGRDTTYNANRALLVRNPDGPRLVMLDGMAQTLHLPERRLSTTDFTDFTVGLGDVVDAPAQRRLDHRELPTPALLAATPELSALTGRSVEYLVREGHLRIAQATLAVGAVIVGYAALMVGGFSRFGLWRQIVSAVLLVVLTKILDNAAVDAAKNSAGAWPLVYVSTVFAGVVCVGLLAAGNANLAALFRRARPA